MVTGLGADVCERVVRTAPDAALRKVAGARSLASLRDRLLSIVRRARGAPQTGEVTELRVYVLATTFCFLIDGSLKFLA